MTQINLSWWRYLQINLPGWRYLQTKLPGWRYLQINLYLGDDICRLIYLGDDICRLNYLGDDGDNFCLWYLHTGRLICVIYPGVEINNITLFKVYLFHRRGLEHCMSVPKYVEHSLFSSEKIMHALRNIGHILCSSNEKHRLNPQI